MPEHSLVLNVDEEVQSVHEEELIDQNGEFIIFASESDDKQDFAKLMTSHGTG